MLIDQTPLREGAGREARRKMREAARLNEVLSEFERTILPGYARWERANLCGLLDEEVRLDGEIRRLELMIHRVHFESLFGGRTRRSVYHEIAREHEMTERSRQGDPGGRAREDHGGEDGPGDREREEDEDLPDGERAFRSYVRFAAGIDPDDLNEREYRRMFREFSKWREGRAGGGSQPAGGRAREEAALRVKELYRVLVRRLHPDSGGSHADAHRARLWHDLQEAYAAKDLERMEVLLAMTDLHEGNDALRTTLYHLRKVAGEMARTVRELKGRLRDARVSPAWIFWHAADRKKAGAQLRAEVESRIRSAREYLVVLEKEIAPWQNKPQSHKQKARPHPSGQGHFSF